MTAAKLSQVVQTNIPMVLTIKNATGKKYESSFKAGEFQYLYFFLDKNGVEYAHYASEPQNDALQHFKNGEQVQLVKQEKKTKDGKSYSMYVWTPPEGVEATMAANPQPAGNTKMAQMDRNNDDHARNQKIKEVMISLAGLTQAHISAGKTNQEALDLAIQARNMIVDAAIASYENS